MQNDSAVRLAPPPRDSILLERIAEGERQALAELFARYSTTLYAVAFAVCPDPVEAHAIVDSAFCEVGWAARRFHPSHYPVRHWLAEITVRAALERLHTRSQLSVTS